MATTSSQSSSKAAEFTINTRAHGHPDGPDHVLVEIIPGRGGSLTAILAAGAGGRYSFDFGVSTLGIEIERAFIEGMREPVDALPEWVAPIRKQIESELGV